MTTLTGNIKTLTGLTPERAELWITSPSIKVNGELRAGGLEKREFDEHGHLSIDLPATNSPGADPVSWQYGFEVRWAGGSLPKFYATLTEDTDLSDLQPVDPAGPDYVPVLITGPEGPQGVKGDKGDVGPQGPEPWIYSTTGEPNAPVGTLWVDLNDPKLPLYRITA